MRSARRRTVCTILLAVFVTGASPSTDARSALPARDATWLEPLPGSTDTLLAVTGGHRLLVRGDGFELPAGERSVSLRVVGADGSACPILERKSGATTSYLVGARPEGWRASVPRVERARYPHVLAGVDLVVRSNREGELEHDFVLEPGIDVASVRLRFDGGLGVHVDEAGWAHFLTESGVVSLRAPRAFVPSMADGREVPCRFRVLSRHELGFEVSGRDVGERLVIDPVLDLSSYLGGEGLDQITDIAVTPEGDLVFVGVTRGADLPVSGDALQAEGLGDHDAFIGRMSTTGELQWLTYLGGTGGRTTATAVELGPAGEIAVAGHTSSPSFPIVGGVQNALAGELDAFVAVLDRGGTAIEWSSYLGGSNRERVNAVAWTVDGLLWIGGVTASLDFPTTAALEPASRILEPFNTDGFLAGFHPGGAGLVTATYLGASESTSLLGLAVDVEGRVHAVGETHAEDYPTVNAWRSAMTCDREPDEAHLCEDGFLTIFDVSASERIFSTYVGGSRDDSAKEIAVDPVGRLVIVGSTSSPDFPLRDPVHPAGPTVEEWLETGFVLKAAPLGRSIAFSTFLGGSEGSTGGRTFLARAVVDRDGMIHVAGNTSDPGVTLVDSLGPAPDVAGDEEAYVVTLTPAGDEILFATTHGGSTPAPAGGFESLPTDWLGGLAVSADGGLWIGGATSTVDFPVANAFQAEPVVSGEPPRVEDAFIARIVGEGLPNVYEPSAIDVRPDIQPFSVAMDIDTRLVLGWEETMTGKYVVHVGSLQRLWSDRSYDHAPWLCDISANETSIEAPPGNAYFLVTARSEVDSSFGRDWRARERAPTLSTCP